MAEVRSSYGHELIPFLAASAAWLIMFFPIILLPNIPTKELGLSPALTKDAPTKAAE